MTNELKGANHKALITRISRIEGQVRGLKNMVEEQKYCIDILTQIKAARCALKGLELQILQGHANHCLLNAIDSGSKDDAQDKIDEIMELLLKSSKS